MHFDLEICFEESDDVVGEGIIGVDEEYAGGGGVRHVRLESLRWKMRRSRVAGFENVTCFPIPRSQI